MDGRLYSFIHNRNTVLGITLTTDWLEIWNGGRFYEYLPPKNFRNFGVKFEFLEPFKNLCFKKKIDFSALFEPIFMKFGGVVDITKIYHQKFFYNFWRQIWGFRANLSQIFWYFGSKNLAPKILNKFLMVDFNNINHLFKFHENWM